MSGASRPSGIARPDDSSGAGGALARYTTLRLGGPAAEFLVAEHADELTEVVRAADSSGMRLLVLGGGSNLVIADSGFDGRVVRIATRGHRFDSAGDGVVRLTVEAGEDWDEIVAETVRQGLGGLECLSGVPGLTGATPVQNVGAYGVEVSEMLTSVDLLDRRTGRVRTLPAEELGLVYRSSLLKHTETAVVLRVRFLLREGGLSAPIRYGELARTLGVEIGDRAPVEQVREAVLNLRRGKGMVLDPHDHDTWSAGSFFTNPVLEAGELADVLDHIATRLGGEQHVPRYPAMDGRTKLSAAWLIEHAGFAKGHRGPGGRVGLSTKHTLALTNRGSASTRDLLELAAEVRDGVRDRFGVSLAPEPVLVDCALE
ncbi:UDP-N-acetylmuramate dehydrogenase [Halopolyspora algeriensis]|uniref:UDP-N-acetylenolpyruvoylglucosamine reductase n=1 Tax=Halopolyspora algeriensis TaxID=1500506 RepID=A0A368W4D7_9ACTN|nr:UDP-N-acetylmuramate dehydrogenase [Halopolyspora algeriensis]RCW46920.1 UDP-N-acetylmuramate dehydrogenase [Halopolyspora algeriensis]TQM48011.1 UDP-N-acetylmuramate dehydrogenase [Halopolyspora algeriensis]